MKALQTCGAKTIGPSFFRMIAAFGFNIFEHWLVLTFLDLISMSVAQRTEQTA